MKELISYILIWIFSIFYNITLKLIKPFVYIALPVTAVLITLKLIGLISIGWVLALICIWLPAIIYFLIFLLMVLVISNGLVDMDITMKIKNPYVKNEEEEE